MSIEGCNSVDSDNNEDIGHIYIFNEFTQLQLKWKAYNSFTVDFKVRRHDDKICFSCLDYDTQNVGGSWQTPLDWMASSFYPGR